MKIKTKMEYVEGTFDTETEKIVCVKKWKYGEVTLDFKANMLIPFAEIKLSSSGTLHDAQEVFKDASKLGDEIEKRWNNYNDAIRLLQEAHEELDTLIDGQYESDLLENIKQILKK